MKIVVVGGAGVFGSRLAELLVRDGHEVVIAARDAARAGRLAARLGAGALRLDLRVDLAPLWQAGPEAVVDAAGPFHTYGADPWRLARGCIERGVHYLDFSDEAAFCTGIAALDAAARARGSFALSGVSSVPALSSAAVAALAEGMERVEDIDIAILPGNRAPRGRSVIAAILARTGVPFALWQGGAWEERLGWSDARTYRLAPGVTRRGYLIEVPDTRLLPARFAAPSVSFRAGLELGLMNAGLAALSRLRRATGLAPGPRAGAALRLLAALLWPFGTARGGMVVRVAGRREGRLVRAEWRLLAEAGQGPFIPAVAARTILGQAGLIEPGARPALAERPLAAFEAALGDLRVTVARDQGPAPALFARVLGPDFAALPGAVRASHDWAGCLRLAGRAWIERGRGRVAAVIAALFGFPAASADIPVTVTKRATDTGETWERDFGGRIFRSRLASDPDGMTERFGPLTFSIGLALRDGALHFPVTAGRVGPVPLPRWLLPVSIASERAEAGRLSFDVDLRGPLGFGRIVRYRGWLARVTPETAPETTSG